MPGLQLQCQTPQLAQGLQVLLAGISHAHTLKLSNCGCGALLDEAKMITDRKSSESFMLPPLGCHGGSSSLKR